LADEAARVLRARAASAFALTENEQEAIRRRLEKAWGGTVALEAVTEEALLGGLTLRVGDRVWDHSLRRQLDRLRDRLVDGAAV
jgi:F-type H+-transporting ATPase subunit delta